MLGRRRELILTIGGLVALNALLCWWLVGRWKEYRSSIQWVSVGVAPQRALASAAGANRAGQPPNFTDIVGRDLFSPLRGSAPAQAQAEVKAPKPPVLFGTMDLGTGRFALMSPGDQSPPVSKRVLPGGEIGGYKLVSIGTSNVVVEWQDKRTTLEITEPANRPGGLASEATARPGTPSSNVPGVVTTVGSVSGGAKAAGAAGLGPAGVPSDAPAGTVVGGKRKVVISTPFGPSVQWQDVVPSGSQGPQQPGAPNK
ncbi:MAG: hypothetical protein ABSF46_06735 [Terriglobia bacterium]|jgi:hypothetical protein